MTASTRIISTPRRPWTTDLPTDVIQENAVPPEVPQASRGQIIAALDIAVLKPDARLEDVTNAARVVEDLGAASVCVASYNVAVAKPITPRVFARRRLSARQYVAGH